MRKNNPGAFRPPKPPLVLKGLSNNLFVLDFDYNMVWVNSWVWIKK